MKTTKGIIHRSVLNPVEVQVARIALARFEDPSITDLNVDSIFVNQYHAAYDPRDHHIWSRLCKQQREYLSLHASELWLAGAVALEFDQDRVPVVTEVSERLKAITGWQIRAVTGYLPARAFFGCLARKILPVTVVVRDPTQEGYLPEPDAFHDMYGHAPLCADKTLAKLLERFGRVGVNADAEQLQRLTNVLWFTMEFGLIREDSKVRILGAGLVSSPDESRHCLQPYKVQLNAFDSTEVAQTSFEIDHFKPKLFILENLQQISDYLDEEGAPNATCGGACKNGGACSGKAHHDHHNHSPVATVTPTISGNARAASESTNPQRPAASVVAHSNSANALDLLGVDHIRMHVGNALQARTFYGATFGFTADQYSDLTTGSRDQASHLMVQGDIRLLLTTGLAPTHTAGLDVARYGDGVADIAFTVRDAEAAYKQALRNGANSAYEPTEILSGNNVLVTAGIRAFGRCVHSLVSRRGACGDANGTVGELFSPNFRKVGADPLNTLNMERPCGLVALDHCVANVGLGQMNQWVDWYSQVLGFKLFKHFDDRDISTKYSALMSKVMDGGRCLVKIPINEPAPGLRKSQVQEFLDWHDGTAGVQHMAFRTGDALATVRELRRRGVAFLALPDAYYERVWERVEGALGRPIDEPHALVKSLGLLLDSDDEGYLLQVFTKPVQDRPTLFVEIIGRKGAKGFGKGNFKALFEALELEQERRGNL